MNLIRFPINLNCFATNHNVPNKPQWVADDYERAPNEITGDPQSTPGRVCRARLGRASGAPRARLEGFSHTVKEAEE